MKTRHIIAIGLLSAIAVAVLGLAIHTGKAKPKTLQTNATYEINQTSLPAGTNTTDQINFQVHGKQEIGIPQPNMKIGYSYTLKFAKSGTTNPANILTQVVNIDFLETTTDEYSPETNDPITFIIQGEIKLLGYTIETHTIEIANRTFYNEVNIETYYSMNNIDYHHEELFQFYEIVNQQDWENYNDYIIDDIPTSVTIDTIHNALEDYSTGSYEAGYNTGYENGLTDGTTTGYQNGYNAGYGIGYNDSDAFNHPIALQPLMLNILTMPFTFISQAFDVTLWPGTAYEFNFANFIKGMIAIATIMFIIKLFTSGFSILGNYTGNHYQNKLTRQKIKESKSRTELNNRTDPNNKTIKKG